LISDRVNICLILEWKRSWEKEGEGGTIPPGMEAIPSFFKKPRDRWVQTIIPFYFLLSSPSLLAMSGPPLTKASLDLTEHCWTPTEKWDWGPMIPVFYAILDYYKKNGFSCTCIRKTSFLQMSMVA